ncbi:MAG: Dam family site-specific DNA-(adenine-N6)-methyltransferase [Candidatus Paceibacterota bacterium]
MESTAVFLKWAGGKRRILPLMANFFPIKFGNYFEPFLGAGSVFFYVKQKYNPSHCTISDTNSDLINTYIHVRDNPKQLIKLLEYFKSQHSKKFYYEVREKFNKKIYIGIKRAAAFIYLNKTCFNGLYRVNSKNEFNVPFGQHKILSVYSSEVIYRASELLNDRVTIKHQDYKEIIANVKKGDFVYLDPCYDPIKKTSFASYTPERFSLDDRTKLFVFIEELKKKNTHIVLSNNDLPEIRKLYSGYNVHEILAPRIIGSRISYRADLIELLITTKKSINYLND